MFFCTVHFQQQQHQQQQHLTQLPAIKARVFSYRPSSDQDCPRGFCVCGGGAVDFFVCGRDVSDDKLT